MITQAFIKQYLDYDPVTGWFTHKTNRGPCRAGDRAGSSTGHGYRKVTVDGTRIYEHHAAWVFMFDEWPNELDHKDGNRSNNAIENLRVCDRSANACNSLRSTGESGLKGAYLDKRTMNWYSHIQLGGQVKHLGIFGSAEEAHRAYLAAAELHHGEFAFHNRPQPLRRI